MTEPYIQFCDTHYLNEYGASIPATENNKTEIECAWGTSQKRQRGAPLLFNMSITTLADHPTGASQLVWYPTRDELVKLITLSNEMLAAYDAWEKCK